MKILSLDECQRDLAALDAADRLTANMKVEIDRFKEMDTSKLMKKAMGMLMSGNLSLEALGLPVNLFEQLEQLEKLNGVARNKYRAVVVANQEQLGDVESVEVKHG
ncbi:hypothetical protein CWO07_26165 [Vibrio splendidus]|jgi:hypothetical protein|uniref:Uncharacterized protein n=3 Tax=Vibrio TaxID=662 RepID=A0A0P6Z2N8_VIBSP|nr:MULTISPECIES: hypothetical protein [Vibrio]CAH6998139.1 conserved hypothetical protein [Vibrio chagasii]KPL97765.1 hypothetical protein AN167_21305 [Vibrio splendidus]MCC4815563.1 hypothetical protein [Vibrio lentus]MCK8074428.1 hypothetical protein [Vibrio sp. 1CM23M]MCQ8870085.1 hypothetical protein [Vibrio splendidus]